MPMTKNDVLQTLNSMQNRNKEEERALSIAETFINSSYALNFNDESEKNLIYLDNAATTKIHPEVVQAMMPYLMNEYGNPSSTYKFGESAKKAINDSRKEIAKVINCREDEIYFTSGGTESDNWAIKSVLDSDHPHIITSKIEHHAILNSCKWLEEHNLADITYLDVDEDGFVNPDDVENAIRENTKLISIMIANNEIGTIQPIKEIGQIAKKHNIPFHVDAVQGFGHIVIDVKSMNITMLSASSHKINGTKGVGFLYVKRGYRLKPFVHGGEQEDKMRAGTENVPGIVGFGKAAQIANETMAERTMKERDLRDHMIKRILNEISDCKLNGSQYHRLPNNVNFSFKGVEGESVLIMLDMLGICASSGSACMAGNLDPSHVLKAIGLSDPMAHSAIRFTLGYETTKEEIDYTVDKLKEIISQLRGTSSDYKE